MGRRYTAKVRRTFEFEISFEAEDGLAWNAADHRAETAEVPHEARVTSSAGSIRAVTGPIVQSAGWHDLHPHLGPSDIILVSAATGHRLSAELCERIEATLSSLGFTVLDKWNVESNRVSFRCSGRSSFAALSAEQVTAIVGDEAVS